MSSPHTRSKAAQAEEKEPPIQLSPEETFLGHSWVKNLRPQYQHDATLALHAMQRLIKDLGRINELFVSEFDRNLFTTIDGRVKTPESFFRKLRAACRQRSSGTGITPKTLRAFYDAIKDLCGVRFACPYFDEIEPAIAYVRRELGELGYAPEVPGLPDKNYLDTGDPLGYRSYHFYVLVPTITNIFQDVELCICEIQARSELQHIWAVKSHDLLYKPATGWPTADAHVAEDMRQLSNSLRAADQSLLSIRDRARGGK